MNPPLRCVVRGLLWLSVVNTAVTVVAQESTAAAGGGVESVTSDGSSGGQPASPAGMTENAILPIQSATAEQIRSLVESGEYVPFSRSRLHELVDSAGPDVPVSTLPPPAIAKALYGAKLAGESLVDGTLTIQRTSSDTRDSLILGRSNLNELKFTAGAEQVPLASLPDGRLSLLAVPADRTLDATWSARGRAVPEGIQFELLLPSAYITTLRLQLPEDMTISKSNAIVRPAADSESYNWLVHPRAGYPLTFVCSRTNVDGGPPQSASLAVDTTYKVAQTTIFAEWKVIAPAVLNDSSVVFAVDSPCRITDVRAESGRQVPWRVREDGRQLILPQLVSGQTIVIQGEAQSAQQALQTLPFLSAVQQIVDGKSRIALSLRSTGLRIVVPRDLAVRSLNLDGLYQTEVGFNSEEQVIDLKRFAVTAKASIEVEPAVATYHQRLLVYRSVTPGVVVVYAEVQPRSGQTWGMEWTLSGPWRPVSVEDVATDTTQPVYSRIKRADEDSNDVLQVHLRSPATPSQPARLRIEFRSTQAVAPQTSSLPGLTNSRCRSMGTWILSPSTSPVDGLDSPQEVADIAEELSSEFPWVSDDLSGTALQRLVRTDQLPIVQSSQADEELTIPRVNVEYELHLERATVTEDIHLRIDPAEQLPEVMVLLFPSGLDVQLTEARFGEELSSTGRGPDPQWQEWLLTLPPESDAPRTVELRVQRSVAAAEFAALPLLPNTSEVKLTALNTTNEEGNVELVSESSGDSESQRETLEPQEPVSIRFIPTRWRLNLSRLSVENEFLAVRGSTWMMVADASLDRRRRCLADLTVSRTGTDNALRMRWPEGATEIQVFIDDHPVFCPPTSSVTEILLPPHQATTSVRILWLCPVGSSGWLSKNETLRLPEFIAVDRLDLAHWVQISAGHLLAADSDDANGSPHSRISSANLSIQSFLMRWRLAHEDGAGAHMISSDAGRISYQVVSTRWLVMTAILVFWLIVMSHRLFAGLRLRYVAALILAGCLLATFGSVRIRSILYGVNTALAVLLVLRTSWQPLVRWWHQSRESVSATTETRTSLVVSSCLALLLTGQAPVDSGLPPVLANAEAVHTSPLVFVRTDLIPEHIAPDTRITDLAAEVRITGGGTEITVSATVVSAAGDSETVYSIPVGNATLTQCSLNGKKVAATYGPRRQPQIMLPRGRQAADDSAIPLAQWQQTNIKYTLRSNVRTRSGRRAIQVPLPYSALCRLTLFSVDDPLISARLADGQTAVPQAAAWSFPTQYNSGTLEILAETARSRAELSDVNRVVSVICRADMSETRTALTCRYRQESEDQLPTEASVSVLPGFRVRSVQAASGADLEWVSEHPRLVVSGTRDQLADFLVMWEPVQEQVGADRVIPVAALQPPARCRAGRTILAVHVSDPFEVKSAIVADSNMTTSTISTTERQTLGLVPSDRCFELDSPSDDIRLKLGLRPTRTEVNITQQLVVGVAQVDWSCQCTLNVKGPMTFRQRVNVPPALLIDQVRVTAGDAGRLRSWSLSDGVLLVSYREGTRGSFQLVFEGTMQIPADGRVQITSVEIPSADVMDSSMQVSSAAGATVALEDADGGFSNSITQPLVNPALPLTLLSRPQNQTTASLVAITQNGVAAPESDIAYRIQAGDRPWDGRVVLPEELGEASIEWITEDSSTPLTAEGSELLMPQLRPGQSATLLLRGIRIPGSSTRRLSLPRLEPPVSIARVRIYDKLPGAMLSDEAQSTFVRSVLDESPVRTTPRGIVDRGHEEQYDARSNSIRLARVSSSRSVSADVVQRAAGSLSVTHVYPADGFLSGRTDVLIDRGDAASTTCNVPHGVKVVRCRLDGSDLPQTSGAGTILVPGHSPVQRMTIEWVLPCPIAGFLPEQYDPFVPAINADVQRQFLAVQNSDNTALSAGPSLVSISEAQLTTHVSQFIDDAIEQTDDSTDPVSDLAAVLNEFPGGNGSEQPLPSWLFERTDFTVADIFHRRTLPWLQWLPMMALVVAWGTVAGRRLSWSRTRTDRSDDDDSAVSSSWSADNSDSAVLGQESDHS